MRFALLILAAGLTWGQCTTLSSGWCNTGLSVIQNNLLGPLIPYASNPWAFGDLAEKGVADNMAPAALAEAPALSTALAGTVSLVSGDDFVTTTSDLTGPLGGQSWVVFAWNSIDGAGTGRALCPIASVTSTKINCSEHLFQPSFSGITAYVLPAPDTHGLDFQSWTTENPTVSWNYYDVGIGLYRLHYRLGASDTTYLGYARQYADITWQWTLDHGYRYTSPRAASMISQFFRALDGHTERLPGLYAWIAFQGPRYVPQFCPYCDAREAGYMTWDAALGANVDPDATRHTAYCSYLTTHTPQWNSTQQSDGSFGEENFAINASYVSAPKAFAAPFIWVGSPWRVAITIKGLEAAYESLNNITTQGCNNQTLAASTLTTITKVVTWQNNYGRDTNNRGAFYEVNSQSDDQNSVSPATGTVSATLTSTAIIGVGTNWNTAGYCDGTHFIGFFGPNDPRTVYKIASCADNTHATLSVAFGLYGEAMSVSAQQYGIAPAASTGCHSSATYCFGAIGDRNLTRTNCGAIGWLYAQTLNATYKSWADECFSASLGGPTSGLTSAATLGFVTLPCSGPACDGLVTDSVAAAANCGSTPCVNGSYLYTNLGKNYGETWGAPGIDNEPAWRLLGASTLTCSPKTGLTPPTVLDIQYQTNMALSLIPCTNPLGGACDVAAVQRVVNAALGGPCITN